MAAKRLPDKWPDFVVRKFTSIEDAYIKFRDFLRSLTDLRRQLIIVSNNHADRLTGTSGSGAPATTPSDTLLFYLDTSAGAMYVSTGTSSSADWKKITP